MIFGNILTKFKDILYDSIIIKKDDIFNELNKQIAIGLSNVNIGLSSQVFGLSNYVGLNNMIIGNQISVANNISGHTIIGKNANILNAYDDGGIILANKVELGNYDETSIDSFKDNHLVTKKFVNSSIADAISGFDTDVEWDKVYLNEDIQFAGSYTQLGNVKKGANETKTYRHLNEDDTRKTVKDLFTYICTTELQPTKTNPTSTINVTGMQDKVLPVGYKCETVIFTGSTNTGSYTYGPTSTGVTVSNHRFSSKQSFVECDSYNTSNNNTKLTINNLVIGDSLSGSNKIKITYSADYSDATTIAKTNLGNQSNPIIKITKGTSTASKTYNSLRSFRPFFYVSFSANNLNNENTIKTRISNVFDSITINNAKNLEAYRDSSVLDEMENPMYKVEDGSYGVAVVIPKYRYDVDTKSTASNGVKKVVSPSALFSEFTNNFKKQGYEIELKGLNGYTQTAPYVVYLYTPGGAIENNSTYNFQFE